MVQQLLDRQVAADLVFEFLDRDHTILKISVELGVFVEARSIFLIAVLDLGVHGHQPQLFGPIEHDLAVDQLTEQIQAQHPLLIRCPDTGRVADLALVILFEFSASDAVAVDPRRHTVHGVTVASARPEDQPYP